MKSPSYWTVDIIDGKPSECYCHINLEYGSKHYKKAYELLGITDTGELKTKVIVNPHYDPRIKKPRKPLYCKKKPGSNCYKNKCPHFGYTEYHSGE